eukprot:9822-Eustigmatos_ZCMA.PRE.1
MVVELASKLDSLHLCRGVVACPVQGADINCCMAPARTQLAGEWPPKARGRNPRKGPDPLW